MTETWKPCSDCAGAYQEATQRFSSEQAEGMYRALLIAYGLTSRMDEQWDDAGNPCNADDIRVMRRQALAALRLSGFGVGA